MGILYGRAGCLTAENGGFRPGQDGKTFTASFNAQASAAKCSASSARPRVAGAASSIVTFAVDLDGAKDLATITLTGAST